MPTHDARRFDVTIVQRPADYAGTLRVYSPDSEDAVREVSGASCAEVFNALAVVTAIWLQPDSQDGASAATPVAAPEKAPTPSVAPPAQKLVADPQSSNGIRTTNELHKDFQVDAGTVRVTRPSNVGARVGIGFFGETPMRYDVTLDSTSFIEAPGAGAARTSPITLFRGSFFGPISTSSDGMKSSIYAYSGAIATCASPYYDTRGFVFLACAELSLGNLHESRDNPQQGSKSSKNTLFGSVGTELINRYNIGLFFAEFDVSLSALTKPAADILGLLSLSLGLGLQFD